MQAWPTRRNRISSSNKIRTASTSGRRAVTVQTEHGSASHVTPLARSDRRGRFGSLRWVAIVSLALFVPLVANASPTYWIQVHPLQIGRTALGATSGPCEGDSSATCLYAIAGSDGSNVRGVVEMYSPSADTWTAVAALQRNRARLGATSGPCYDTGKTCLYAIGGEDSLGNSLSSVEQMRPSNSVGDVGANRWVDVASLQTPRGSLTATSGLCTNNFSATCLYAIGGADVSRTVLSSVEMYTPGNDSWTYAPSLQMARYSLAATSGPCPHNSINNCLYAIGGYGSGGSNTLKSVEYYSFGFGAWSYAAPMYTARAALAATNGPCQNNPGTTCLYAIGGYSANGALLNSVEMYNPSSDTWTTVEPLIQARSYLAAASGPCSGNLSTTCPYAIGGEDANGASLNLVEMYGSILGPTAAWVSRFTAQRRGETVSFHWKLVHSTGVAGFALYGGQTRLNTRTIAVHAAAAYHSTVHWSGPGRFTLRVLLTNGQFVTVPAR